MLLPDTVQPRNSIYFNGAIVLEVLQEVKIINFLALFGLVTERQRMSMSVFTLCLDWLYLIDVALVNSKGEVELCI